MSDSFDSYLRELFDGLGPVSLRRMFGGQGLYHQGLMIGLVADEELFLKTDEATREAFEQAGGQPFVYHYKGKPITMSYWAPPPEAMESAQAMQPWARLAYAAAVRKAAVKPTAKKRLAAKPE